MLSAHHRDETIDLQQKLARVQSLLDAARRVHATIHLDDVLAGVLEIAAKELEAEGAFFVSGAAELGSRVDTYGEVPENWKLWTEEGGLPGYAFARLVSEREDTLAHLVIYRPHALSLEEEDFLEGLALQSALAVGNAQHHERTLEFERVQLDLDAARAIQRSLLPPEAPDVAGYSLSFRSTACYEVGGDYVDVVHLPDGRLMMALADVAGKGMASALMSMTFRSSFRAIAGIDLPLAEIAARLNTLHWQEGMEARRRYVTAILMCLDPKTHRLEVVNAGHNPAFLRTCAGREAVKVNASGLPLGMMPGRTYESEIFDMGEGSEMLLYTDGLTEVFQGDDEFGEDRLMALLGARPAPEFLEHVWQTLAQFAGNAHQTDDMTALYLCRAANQGGNA